MRLIKPTFEIIEQQIPLREEEDYNDLYRAKLLDAINKHIELCGRTCYKSTDKITESSAKPFVDRMIASRHYAMLEHGTIYLKVPIIEDDICERYYTNPYSIVRVLGNFCYITTNLRVLVENSWEDTEYLCAPTEHHTKRITVKFICDNGIAREFCRHRVFSFAQESTRYCNYSKDKFDNELTFILPCWNVDNAKWLTALETAEQCYMDLLKDGWKPEQARNVLPLSLKTELIMTGTIDQWKYFFNLRADGATGKPHPQAEELAKPLKEEFIKRGYINNKLTI